jgi:RHS repeat-associated protein
MKRFATKIETRNGALTLGGRRAVVLMISAFMVALTAPALSAGASAPRSTIGPSRLYVGTTLRVGGELSSTSGVYRAEVLERRRIELLKHNHVVWTSNVASEFTRFIVRGSKRAADAASPEGRERLSGVPTSSDRSYLTIENDGEVALISAAGVTMLQGGIRAHVTGSSVAPYTPGALYGNTNPSVLCYTCDASNVTGIAPPSDTLDSGTSVDNMTGDFSTSNPLFDASAIGGDLALSLSYDAQLAQSQLTNSTSGLTFGEGWSSNFSSSVSTGTDPLSGYPDVTVNQGDGAQVIFTQSADSGTSTSCQSSGDPSGNQYPGDYPFTTKYTASGSTYNFCALASVQGQLSEIPGTGFTYQVSGGQTIQDYSWTGQLNTSTTSEASSGTPAEGLVYYSASAGTTSAAGVTLVNACPSGATYGCTIIYTNDGRDIVEVLNSLGEVTEVIDPSGATYSLTYSASTRPNNLITVSKPSPTGSGAATWTYEYSASASPYSSDLVQIYDPDAASPSGFSSGALHSTTITYGTGTYAGMVTSLIDGSGSSASTTYSYASGCATGSCAEAGGTQTTTILYPAECPNSTTTCTSSQWPTTVAADIPQEIDQYTNGLETSTQLGSQTNSSEVETWLYSWDLGNGVANTSEQITYPDTLQGTSPVIETSSIVTDPAGNIISTTNPLGDVATSFYNETTSLNVPEMEWSFPGPSSDATSTGPSGSSQYTYNSFGQVVTATDPMGNTTYYGYYSHYSLPCYEVSAVLAGRLGWTTSTTPPSCSSSSTVYDAGAISAPTDSTTYSYDEQGDVTGSTIDSGDSGANADPQTTTASYNSMGNLLWTIPPAGQSGAQSYTNVYATSYAYVTGTSLPSTRYQPDWITTQYQYDAVGNLTSTANDGAPVWVATTTLYDGDNRPCYQLNAYGNFGASCTAANARGSTSWTYEPGTTDVFQTTDSNSDVSTNYYADLAYPNSPTEGLDAAGSEIQYSAYNDYGNACVSGDATPTLGSTQCSSVPSGDSGATYDALGNQLTLSDPSGNVTTNAFENSSYPTLETRTTNSMGALTTYSYSADGNLVTTTNPDNSTGVTMNYNANGQVCNKMPTLVQYPCVGATVSGVNYGEGPSVAGVTEYGYNNAGELSSMSDNVANPATPTLWSQVTTYSYATGLLMSTTDGNGKTINYAYDDNGQPWCVAYPVSASTNCNSTPSTSNTVVTRSYDALGRLSSSTDWLGNTVSYTYGNASTPNSPTTISYPSATGVSASYGFDNDGNLTSLSAASTVTSGTAISDAWTYNSDEQVAESSINGASSGWQNYNSNRQVTQAANLGTSTSNDTYTLASNGDITSDAAPSGSTTNFAYYNDGGELCNTAATATTCGTAPANGAEYTYTANGERASTRPYVSSVAGTTTNYNWNAYGELCSTGPSSSPTSSACGTLPSGGSEYQYNGNGLRTSTTTSSGSGSTSTISAVGSLQQADGTGTSSLSVDPVNGGDAFVLAIKVASSSVTVASVTGGGATWQHLTSESSSSRDVELWMGTITTTGSSTISVSYSGSVASDSIELDAQEYTNGTGSTTAWSKDVAGGLSNTSSSTTVTFPTLTPSSPAELYVGYARMDYTGSAGSTSGFTYDVTSPNLDLYIYNSNVSSSVSPTGDQATAGTSLAVGALITASVPSSIGSTTDSTWDTVSSGTIPLNINDATTTSGSITNVSYVYGDLLFGGTAPMEQITTSSSGTSVSYLVSNQTGVQGAYNGSGSSLGAVQEMAVYSVYGVQSISLGSKITPFGFQGSYTDPTGLIYLINRYYDPSIGQFLSIDPDVATTDQPYLYTGDDPLNAEDPLGLSPATNALAAATTALEARVAAATLNADPANVAAVKALEARVSSDLNTARSQAVAQYVATGTSVPVVVATAGRPASGAQSQAVADYVSDTQRPWCYASVAISAGGSLGMTGMATVSSGVLADGPPAWVAAIAGGVTVTAIIFTIKLALDC